MCSSLNSKSSRFVYRVSNKAYRLTLHVLAYFFSADTNTSGSLLHLTTIINWTSDCWCLFDCKTSPLRYLYAQRRLGFRGTCSIRGWWGETLEVAAGGKLLGINEIRHSWYGQYWRPSRRFYYCSSLLETGTINLLYPSSGFSSETCECNI